MLWLLRGASWATAPGPLQQALLSPVAEIMPRPSFLYYTSDVLAARRREIANRISCAVGMQPSLRCIRAAQTCLVGTHPLTVECVYIPSTATDTGARGSGMADC